MPWERVTAHGSEQIVSIYPDGGARLHKSVRDRLDDLPLCVGRWVDVETGRIRLKPVDPDDESDTATVFADGGTSLGRCLRALGTSVEEIDKTVHCPATVHNGAEVVIDCSGMLDIGLQDSESNEDGHPDYAESHCPDCNATFRADSQGEADRRMKVHRSRAADCGLDGESEVGDDEPDATGHSGDLDLTRFGTSGASPTQEMVVQALAGNQSVHQVERDLGLGRRETEELLKRLGILEELQNGSPKMPRDRAERIVEEAVDG